MKNIRKKSGQSIIEYTIVAVLVILGIVIMGPYVLRSIGAHFKLWDESVQDSFKDRFVQASVSEVPNLPGLCTCTATEGACGTDGCGAGYKPEDVPSCTDTKTGGPCDPIEAGWLETSSCKRDSTCCVQTPGDCGTIALPVDSNGNVSTPNNPYPPDGYTDNCYYNQRVYSNQGDCAKDHPFECHIDNTGNCAPKCSGSIDPSVATACTDSTASLTASQTWSYVGQCPSTNPAPCTFQCSSGYVFAPNSGTCVACTNLLANSSFESPAITANSSQQLSSIPGWSTDTSCIQIINGPFDKKSHLYDEHQVVEMNSCGSSSGTGGSIWQTVSTVPGMDYQLTFYYLPYKSKNTADGQIGVFFNDNLISPSQSPYSYNAVASASPYYSRLAKSPEIIQDPLSATKNAWIPYTFMVHATSTSSVIKFTDQSTAADGKGGYLNAVQLVPISCVHGIWVSGPVQTSSGKSYKCRDVCSNFVTNEPSPYSTFSNWGYFVSKDIKSGVSRWSNCASYGEDLQYPQVPLDWTGDYPSGSYLNQNLSGGSVQEGNDCYSTHFQQVQDNDPTDITVACYCMDDTDGCSAPPGSSRYDSCPNHNGSNPSCCPSSGLHPW